MELLLSEHGIWDQSLGRPQEYGDWLVDSYVRRLRFEQRSLAVAVVNVLGEAMSKKRQARTVNPDEFLRMTGGM